MAANEQKKSLVDRLYDKIVDSDNVLQVLNAPTNMDKSNILFNVSVMDDLIGQTTSLEELEIALDKNDNWDKIYRNTQKYPDISALGDLKASQYKTKRDEYQQRNFAWQEVDELVHADDFNDTVEEWTKTLDEWKTEGLKFEESAPLAYSLSKEIFRVQGLLNKIATVDEQTGDYKFNDKYKWGKSKYREGVDYNDDTKGEDRQIYERLKKYMASLVSFQGKAFADEIITPEEMLAATYPDYEKQFKDEQGRKIQIASNMITNGGNSLDRIKEWRAKLDAEGGDSAVMNELRAEVSAHTDEEIPSVPAGITPYDLQQANIEFESLLDKVEDKYVGEVSKGESIYKYWVGVDFTTGATDVKESGEELLGKDYQDDDEKITDYTGDLRNDMTLAAKDKNSEKFIELFNKAFPGDSFKNMSKEKQDEYLKQWNITEEQFTEMGGETDYGPPVDIGSFPKLVKYGIIGKHGFNLVKGKFWKDMTGRHIPDIVVEELSKNYEVYATEMKRYKKNNKGVWLYKDGKVNPKFKNEYIAVYTDANGNILKHGNGKPILVKGIEPSGVKGHVSTLLSKLTGHDQYVSIQKDAPKNAVHVKHMKITDIARKFKGAVKGISFGALSGVVYGMAIEPALESAVRNLTGSKKIGELSKEALSLWINKSLGQASWSAYKKAAQHNIAKRHMPKVVKTIVKPALGALNKKAGKSYFNKISKVVDKVGWKRVKKVISDKAPGKILKMGGKFVGTNIGAALTAWFSGGTASAFSAAMSAASWAMVSKDLYDIWQILHNEESFWE